MSSTTTATTAAIIVMMIRMMKMMMIILIIIITTIIIIIIIIIIMMMMMIIIKFETVCLISNFPLQYAMQKKAVISCAPKNAKKDEEELRSIMYCSVEI